MDVRIRGAVGPAIISLAMCVILAGIVSAWSNGGYSADPNNPDYGTHDWIANAALQPQTKDVTFLKTTYNAQFLLGTEAPDNPAYIGDTGSHHFYYHSDKTIQDDVDADRAASIFASALQYINSDDLDLAAFEVGVMAHYISDVGVFGHTMGASTDWGAEVHHSDYENGFESRLGSLLTPSVSLGNLDAYDATAGLAYKITFGSGAIKPNIWMDTNYDWFNSVFEGSAMASLNASVTAVAAAINHLMIEATSSSNPPPIELDVMGSISLSNGTRPLSVSFTSSPSGGVPPYTYSWAFGDGAVSHLQNPSHVYNSTGTFSASLTVSDSLGHIVSWTKKIIVTEPTVSGTVGVEVIAAIVTIIAAISAAPLYILRRRRKRER